MAKLDKLNNSLLRSVSRAALGADAPAEDENDVAEGEDEDTPPPAGRRGKAKKATRRSRRAQEEDETAEDDEETAEGEDDLDAEDEDPDAEDDLDPDAEDDDDLDAEDEEETAEGEDEDDVPPTGRRGKAKKAIGRGARSANSGERARISAITRSKLAAGREDLADFLAFDTGLGAKLCTNILKHAPKARSATTLRSRMASVENPRIKATARGAEVSDEDREVQSAVKTAQQFGF